MAMSATISVPGNVIANQPFTAVILISNSGASAVNVTSIAPKVFVPGTVTLTNQSSGPVQFSPVFVPVGTAVTSTTGMQSSIQVTAGGTAYVTFQGVVLSPTDMAAQAANGGASYQVSADIAADDGTVFSPPAVPLAVAAVQNGRPSPPPNSTATTYGGALQFNLGTNSALLL